MDLLLTWLDLRMEGAILLSGERVFRASTSDKPCHLISRVIRFGVFELEPQVGILRKHGFRIRLQEQPFRVLLALIEKRGEIVTREELRDRIWSGAAYGDCDHSLNIAVNKIRHWGIRRIRHASSKRCRGVGIASLRRSRVGLRPLHRRPSWPLDRLCVRTGSWRARGCS